MRISVIGDAGQLFHRLEHDPVLEREALENRARVLRRAVRLWLTRVAAVVRDCRDHAARVKERRMVGVEERSESVPRLARERQQLFVSEVVSLIRPIAPARLQQPETGDVLEQSGRPAHAAFVREVQLARALRDHRCAQLRPEQRPRARARETPGGRRRARPPPPTRCRGRRAQRPACREARGARRRRPFRRWCRARRPAGRIRVGTSSSRSRSVAHDRVRASMNCVVVALVNSAVISPVSQ